MIKDKIGYVCNACGAFSPKWAGQCADCGGWNCLTETQLPTKAQRQGGYAGSAQATITSLAAVALETVPRIATASAEFNRVLGGGLVPGSVVLMGGDPGIGKSTLLLEIVGKLSRHKKTLYVTGEESLQQVTMRAHRMGLADAAIRLLAETRLEAILAAIKTERPEILVIDSIQTMYTELLPSAPGSVGQVRESAAQLVRYAKTAGVAIFLVGHVTKEGTLAGPRVLEHMVDTVLYFEGQSDSRFRVIRAVKNRFGAVNELGIFAMTEKGLREVSNPSAIFLSRYEVEVPGSVVMATWEGSRPLLVEVQALVDQSHLGNPRRVTVGLEANRLAMCLAVLHRHGGIVTYDQDVFVNVVGGVRVTETAADLAVVAAIVSSLRSRPLPLDIVIFGEVGLAGEIRPVQGGQERLREVMKHGFKKAIVPKANAHKFQSDGMEIIAVEHISAALEAI
jgi:DNA repair protein RadA/Sms